MAISLPDSIENILKAKVADGLFNTLDEVMQDGSDYFNPPHFFNFL